MDGGESKRGPNGRTVYSGRLDDLGRGVPAAVAEAAPSSSGAHVAYAVVGERVLWLMPDEAQIVVAGLQAWLADVDAARAGAAP